MNERPDPVESWIDVSARAARATGFRTRPEAEARRSAGLPLATMTVALAVIVVALALRPASGTGSDGSVLARADDGMFRFELTTPRAVYGPDDAIEPVASVTYLGPDRSIRAFHAASPIGFRIEEIGGTRTMTGGTRLPCRSTELAKGVPDVVVFGKSGSPTGDPSRGFDLAWYQSPSLRLPVGSWRILADLDVSVGDGCGAQRHQLSVANEIRVVAGGVPVPPATDAPNPTVSPRPPKPSPATTPSLVPFVNESVVGSADDGTFRLALVTPRGIYGVTEAIEPVATLTFLGPGAEVTIAHANPAISFRIEEIGGDRQMSGARDDICEITVVSSDRPTTAPFTKGGQVGLGFDAAWFQDPILLLPAGTWRISATLDVSINDCRQGAETHRLTVQNVISVVDDSGTGPSSASSGP